MMNVSLNGLRASFVSFRLKTTACNRFGASVQDMSLSVGRSGPATLPPSRWFVTCQGPPVGARHLTAIVSLVRLTAKTPTSPFVGLPGTLYYLGQADLARGIEHLSSETLLLDGHRRNFREHRAQHLTVE